MKNENRSYGRCADGVITEFAPDPLQWSKVHAETWTDEDGIEQTSEWTERKTLLHPTEQDYNDMGWFRIESNAPTPPDGQHVKSYRHEQDGNRIVRVYEYDDDAPKPILISKSKVEAVVDQMGKTAAFMAWLNSRAQYIGAWLRGGDEIAYDPADNGSDLASLMAALGIGADEIGGLIQQVVA